MNIVHYSVDFMNSVHYSSPMPKLIHQLENQIIEKAERLFSTDGFDGVSMRKLADELNIAVGTLYNYFPNKTVLFYSIMASSWEETVTKIQLLSERLEAPSYKIRRAAVELIYDGIQERGAFTHKAFELSSSASDVNKLKSHAPHWQSKLIKSLKTALSPLGAGFSGNESERLIQMLIATIRYFIITSGSEEKENDLNFLMQLIEEQN